MMVTKVDAKPLWVDIIQSPFLTKDKRTIYNVIYRDGKSGPSYIKDLTFQRLPGTSCMICKWN
jgi:topoisomerase-4 subunit A